MFQIELQRDLMGHFDGTAGVFQEKNDGAISPAFANGGDFPRRIGLRTIEVSGGQRVQDAGLVFPGALEAFTFGTLAL